MPAQKASAPTSYPKSCRKKTPLPPTEFITFTFNLRINRIGPASLKDPLSPLKEI
jgi:hypothetical protein